MYYEIKGNMLHNSAQGLFISSMLITLSSLFRYQTGGGGIIVPLRIFCIIEPIFKKLRRYVWFDTICQMRP